MRTDRNAYKSFQGQALNKPWKREAKNWLNDLMPPLLVGCVLAGALWLMVY